MLRSLLAAIAMLTLCACANTQATSSAPARDCFRVVDVNRYSIIDDQHIRVTINPQREYILTLQQNARDLDWTTALEIRSRTSFVCVGDGLYIELMGGNPVRPYDVMRIERAPPTAPEGS